MTFYIEHRYKSLAGLKTVCYTLYRKSIQEKQ